MLERSELFGLHTADLRQGIRVEAFKLRERCSHEIGVIYLKRYAIFIKFTYDEADEFYNFSNDKIFKE